MTDLEEYAAFLTARWGEIEQVARAAVAAHPAPWKPGYDPTDWDRVTSGSDVMDPAYDCSHVSAAHIALHDPALVLADLAAKRAILAAHRPSERKGLRESWMECSTCFDPGTAAGEYNFEIWPCPTVAALAEPFRDHPDHPEASRTPRTVAHLGIPAAEAARNMARATADVRLTNQEQR